MGLVNCWLIAEDLVKLVLVVLMESKIKAKLGWIVAGRIARLVAFLTKARFAERSLLIVLMHA